MREKTMSKNVELLTGLSSNAETQKSRYELFENEYKNFSEKEKIEFLSFSEITNIEPLAIILDNILDVVTTNADDSIPEDLLTTPIIAQKTPEDMLYIVYGFVKIIAESSKYIGKTEFSEQLRTRVENMSDNDFQSPEKLMTTFIDAFAEIQGDTYEISMSLKNKFNLNTPKLKTINANNPFKSQKQEKYKNKKQSNFRKFVKTRGNKM